MVGIVRKYKFECLCFQPFLRPWLSKEVLPCIRIIKITASCDEVGLPIIMDLRRLVSGDLRQKVVEALERGTHASKTARLFGVSLSAVKRYARMARREASAEAEEGAWQAPKAR